MNNIAAAFILTCIAGFSTLIGTLFIFRKKSSDKLVKYALAFAAGTMICVSFTDLVPSGISLLIKDNTKLFTFILIFLFILVGIIISSLIDIIIPESKHVSDNNKKLYKVGVFSLLAIIAHNIPEGIATFLSSTTDLALGITLTVAITLHNIPEGISISVPIYHATGSRKKAFGLTFLSAIAEPVGALLAFFLLKPIITDTIMGTMFAIIAGIMMHIAASQLLPTAMKYDEKKKTIMFFIIGFIIMFISHTIFHAH